MASVYDAIAVGSGFGGAIVACRLGEAGRGVCVLERGRPFSRDRFVECPQLSEVTIVHPLAGCPMADDPAHGVVDDVGRVHGYRGLRVLEGSIVPTALGVNPSKTIAEGPA